MKILQIITSLNTGGAEKLTVDSVPIYQKKGINTDVLVLKDEQTPFCKQLRKSSKGKITGLVKGSVYSPLLIFRIIPYLRKYEIVHVHLFPALYWVVLAKWLSFSRTKIVYTEHNTNNKRRGIKVFKLIDRFIYKRLAYIGCISEATQINLKNHLNHHKDNMSVILNGIDLSHFNTVMPSDFSYFEKDSFILIQVSSFREQKDQPTVIKALSFLPDNVKLLLVGDGYLRKKNEEEARRLGIEKRVLFLGIRNDIPELLRYADVCVLSSHYEGFGLAVLEGMASGRPSIATDVSGVREIVNDHGLLFKPGDAQELANHILKLYEDKVFYDKIAKQCLERAQEFDIQKMVDSYIQVYKKVFNDD